MINKYTQKKKKKVVYRIFYIGLYFLSFSLLFLFNYMGFFKLKKIKKENNLIEQQIKEKIEILKQLEKEKIRLEEDIQYIEKIARREFKMAKKDEKVFTIINKKLNKGKN